MDDNNEPAAGRQKPVARRTRSTQSREATPPHATLGWQADYRDRPVLYLTAAFASGIALATLWRSQRHEVGAERTSRLAFAPAVNSQAGELWNDIQEAMAGVASAWVKDYISERVPGFAEQYQRSVDRRVAR